MSIQIPQGRTVVGVSGGADSVALLSLLKERGVDCVAVHCNFGLRGEESLRDERFVGDLCAHLDIPLHVRRFDAAAEARARGESVEMACRRLRYDLFEEVRRSEGAEWIAVAHNSDDQIETLFINLLRISGSKGLRGMLPRQGRIVRPLLGFSRADIEAYLAWRGLTHIEDSSNAGDDYLRNRIRHHLLPALERVLPEARARILSSMALLAREDKILDECDEERRYRAIGFSPSVAAEIRRCRELGRSGGLFYDTEGTAWTLHRGNLERMPQAPAEISGGLEDMPLETKEVGRGDFRPDRSGTVLWLDADALPAEGVWEWRGCRTADRMEPFGMGGKSRLLSDIMSDAGLSRAQKSRARVLTLNGAILWAYGLRTSRHYAVTPSTSRILRLSLKQE